MVKWRRKLKRTVLNPRQFFEEITGRFTLSIPKNTWIVSPQMNIELSGEIDVVKTVSHFELFGSVSVKRGRIEVYGKEFEVMEGRIIFNGGEKLNPELAMTLQYVVRGSNRLKQTLQISVHGAADDPKLAFSLDGSEISEGDAISYIAFGKSLGQLTQGERSNVENQEQSIAKTLAGNFLAAQVSSSLGDALGLDVIEIRGDENWQRATLTAGKYITDDLYVSYERGFGGTEANEVSPRIVTAEYELTTFLFLQLVEGNDKSAGFDVILKFSWD
ncbi:MAG: translocation/assembly module TamB domain-containing protein [Melioribacteraceae bacterium]|nr:translocation/assembly module TamB domain-containing protein [Melioribacteraceae bacterium]